MINRIINVAFLVALLALFNLTPAIAANCSRTHKIKVSASLIELVEAKLNQAQWEDAKVKSDSIIKFSLCVQNEYSDDHIRLLFDLANTFFDAGQFSVAQEYYSMAFSKLGPDTYDPFQRFRGKLAQSDAEAARITSQILLTGFEAAMEAESIDLETLLEPEPELGSKPSGESIQAPNNDRSADAGAPNSRSNAADQKRDQPDLPFQWQVDRITIFSPEFRADMHTRRAIATAKTAIDNNDPDSLDLDLVIDGVWRIGQAFEAIDDLHSKTSTAVGAPLHDHLFHLSLDLAVAPLLRDLECSIPDFCERQIRPLISPDWASLQRRIRHSVAPDKERYFLNHIALYGLTGLDETLAPTADTYADDTEFALRYRVSANQGLLALYMHEVIGYSQRVEINAVAQASAENGLAAAQRAITIPIHVVNYTGWRSLENPFIYAADFYRVLGDENGAKQTLMDGIARAALSESDPKYSYLLARYLIDFYDKDSTKYSHNQNQSQNEESRGFERYTYLDVYDIREDEILNAVKDICQRSKIELTNTECIEYINAFLIIALGDVIEPISQYKDCWDGSSVPITSECPPQLVEGTSADEDIGRKFEVSMLFGTTRDLNSADHRSPKLSRGEYFGHKIAENQRGWRGRVLLSAPLDELGPPMLEGLFEDNNDRVWYFTMSEPTIFGNDNAAYDKFVQELNADLTARDSTGDVLIYVHGVANTFSDAAKRAAQLSYDLSFDGTTTFYTWPTRSHFLFYDADTRAAKLKGVKEDYERFLRDVSKVATRIHIITHSHGAELTRDVLSNIPEKDRGEIPLGQIVFAAPDVDVIKMERSIRTQLTGWPDRITVYTSKSDIAMFASWAMNFSIRNGWGGRIAATDADTIEAQDVVPLLSHGYFAQEAKLAADIRAVLWHNELGPDGRCFLQSTNRDWGPGWRFMKNACNITAFDIASAMLKNGCPNGFDEAFRKADPRMDDQDENGNWRVFSPDQYSTTDLESDDVYEATIDAVKTLEPKLQAQAHQCAQ